MSTTRDMKVFDECGKEIPWARLMASGEPMLDYTQSWEVRPTCVAVRMARGWRVYGVDLGLMVAPLHPLNFNELYEYAKPGLRFPTIDAARMYLKLLGGQLD